MDDDLSQYYSDIRPKRRDLTKPLLSVFVVLSAVMVWINTAPPQISPWWDCAVGPGANNMEARIRLLTSCLQDGDLQGRDRAHIRFMRGNAFAALERPLRAIEDYDAAIRLNPQYGDAYYNRGRSRMDVRRFKEAVDDFGAAIRLNPKDADAYHNRAYLNSWMGRSTWAMQDLNDALRINPQHFRALFSRGYLHLRRSDPDAALVDLERALEINPDNAKSLYFKAYALAWKRHYIAAIHGAIAAMEASRGRWAGELKVVELRKYVDGFNFANQKQFNERRIRRRPKIYANSMALLVWSYDHYLRRSSDDVVARVQAYLKDEERYEGEVDGVHRSDLSRALINCAAVAGCELDPGLLSQGG